MIRQPWKAWSDHPITVAIVVITALIGAGGVIYQMVRDNSTDVSTTAIATSTSIIPPIEKCLVHQENGGTLVMEADQYVMMMPGREHSYDKINPNRNASAISWQINQDFPHTLRAMPDIQNTNTMSDTNGPALIYLIEFKKTGTYHVYIRGFGSNSGREGPGAGDSIHVGLSGVPVTTNFLSGFSLFSKTLEPKWYWETEKGEIASFQVPNPGLYTFYIWARENGVNVQRIWLDTGLEKVQNEDSSYGPPSSPCQSSISAINEDS